MALRREVIVVICYEASISVLSFQVVKQPIFPRAFDYSTDSGNLSSRYCLPLKCTFTKRYADCRQSDNEESHGKLSFRADIQLSSGFS